jgi:type I restriction enzyme S subunit
MNHVTGSTGSRQRVKPQDTLSYKFAMPNSDMLQEFCEVIDGIYTKRNNNLNENQNIKAIRDTLLPKLMSGEIRGPLDEAGDAS